MRLEEVQEEDEEFEEGEDTRAVTPASSESGSTLGSGGWLSLVKGLIDNYCIEHTNKLNNMHYIAHSTVHVQS